MNTFLPQSPIRARRAIQHLLLLVGLLLGVPPTAQATPDFHADFRAFELPDGIGSSVLADFDEDGHLDLAATVASPSNSLVLLFGDGQGGFSLPVTLGVNRGSLAVADLNGDGHADLLNSRNEKVAVYLGNGDGTFAAPVLYGPGGSSCCPQGLAVGDFTGSGEIDVVIGTGRLTTDDGSFAIVLPGLGSGALADSVGIELAKRPLDFISGDVNHDGRDDFIAEHTGDSLSIVLAEGTGFSTPSTLVLLENSDDVAIGDIDEDGHPDLVSGSSWFRGHGDGTFDPRVDFGGSDVHSPVLADMNGDGHVEIVAETEGYEILIRYGHGDGTFEDPVEFITTNAVQAIQIADLDHDGRPDVVVSSAYGSVAVHLQNPDGTFGIANDYAEAMDLRAGEVGDFDWDGKADVAAFRVDQTLQIVPGLGDGTFGAPFTASATAATFRVASGDVDGDGHPDLVSSSFYGPVSVFLSRGGGVFAPRMDSPNAGLIYGIAVADLDLDGRSDVVTASIAPSRVFVQRSGAGGVLEPPVEYPIGPNARAVAVADLNGDPLPDVIVLRSITGFLEVKLGIGGGQLGPSITMSTPVLATAFTFADLNGDGRVDVVGSGAYLFVMLGNGDGTFTTSSSGRRISYAPGNLVLADVDLDSHLDLVIALPYEDAVKILPGQGDATFGAAVMYGAGFWPEAVGVAELDGDGLPDLVTIHHEGVAVLLNALPGAAGVVPGRTGASIALRGPWPNPATDRFTVEASVPDAGAARVDWIDAGGRLVASRSIAGPGPHRVEWSRAGQAPGVYWIRLSQGMASTTRRIALIR